jgi:dimethylsulfoniopropionate demethylase
MTAGLHDGLHMARRIRRTPYTDRVEAAGVRGFAVTNHMLLPKAYATGVEEDYWHLRSQVQIWDVSCERQVEIEGPDAVRLVQWMTPRDISRAKVGQCLYVPITDAKGGMLNDPVLLKLAEDRFWLSIADSDLLLFAMGLAYGAKLDVQVCEPDVSPLAIQGPKADDVAARLFGEEIRDLGFFRFRSVEFQGTQQIIARSGYSRQGGFEIYLNDGQLGPALWDAVMAAGAVDDIRPGCPNLIERIEGGLFSYGSEMTRENNPLEMGLGKFCKLDGSIDFIGREALQQIARNGVAREIRGVLFDGDPCTGCAIPWPVLVGDAQVGQITSGIWSPRLERNVGLALIDRDYWAPGQKVRVVTTDGAVRSGEISALPFA